MESFFAIVILCGPIMELCSEENSIGEPIRLGPFTEYEDCLRAGYVEAEAVGRETYHNGWTFRGRTKVRCVEGREI